MPSSAHTHARAPSPPHHRSPRHRLQYASDIFATLFEADPLSSAAGLRYRRVVLEAGGSRDAQDFLVELLGRQPSNAAFLRAKGLPPAAA